MKPIPTKFWAICGKESYLGGLMAIPSVVFLDGKVCSEKLNVQAIFISVAKAESFLKLAKKISPHSKKEKATWKVKQIEIRVLE